MSTANREMNGPSAPIEVILCDVSTYLPSTNEQWERDALSHLPQNGSDVRDRIARYQKGCSSPAQFDPKTHDDTKCFLFGRLLLQAAATYAAQRRCSSLFTPATAIQDGAEDHPRLSLIDRTFCSAAASTSALSSSPLPCYLAIGKTSEGKPRIVPSSFLLQAQQPSELCSSAPAAAHETSKSMALSGGVPSLWNASVTHHGRVVGIATSGWEPPSPRLPATSSSLRPQQETDETGDCIVTSLSPLVGLDVMQVELVPLPKSVVDRLSVLRANVGGGGGESGSSGAEIRRSLERGKPLSRREGVDCLNAIDSLEDEFFHYFLTYFTPREWQWIREGTSCTAEEAAGEVEWWLQGARRSKGAIFFAQLWRFFINWVLKESYIKAIGIGLGLSLQRAEFRVRPITDERTPSPTFRDEGVHPNTCAPLPLAVELYLDGTRAQHWQFSLFDVESWNSVAALAVGPPADAVDPTLFGDAYQKKKNESLSSLLPTVTPPVAVRGLSNLHAQLVDCEDVLTLYGV